MMSTTEGSMNLIPFRRMVEKWQEKDRQAMAQVEQDLKRQVRIAELDALLKAYEASK
jgi:hypothetical protein